MPMLEVFSTPVEVFLVSNSAIRKKRGLLHARGGVSIGGGIYRRLDLSSPRPWRCFPLECFCVTFDKVFSTPVEVFLRITRLLVLARSLLHARGGVSIGAEQSTRMAASSPRPWRCFQFWGHALQGLSVFSTPVEVFLWLSSGLVGLLGLLHARGGVSQFQRIQWAGGVSSPRPWRCFCNGWRDDYREGVFSTPVEVFLFPIAPALTGAGLLHARGGVSADRSADGSTGTSSPRPWRCFSGSCFPVYSR